MNTNANRFLLTALIFPLSAVAADFSITVDSEFDAGVMQSVDHDAPNSDQLQISSTISTFPVLWIANAGEDSLSKIDTDNDCETARYETWFNTGTHSAWSGVAPSRTAVDADGNVFVANRHFDGKPVSILKVLVEGGIDRNGNGVIDTSTDTNGDCVIQPGEMIPLVDLNGNGVLEDNELADERVAFVEQIPNTDGHLGRSLCIDNQGDVWAGTYSGNRSYYELSPVDGSVIGGPVATGVGNYGCVVDKNGILFGASLGGSMPIIDTNAHVLLGTRTHGLDYGIGAGNDKIYKGRAAGPYLTYDPNSGPGEPDGNPVTGTFSSTGSHASSLGVSVDGNGDIVQGNSSIRKFDGATDALVWATANPVGGGGDTRGVVADSSNNIWAVNRAANNTTKFRGTDGQYLNTVPTGNQPYTYSDATGIGFQLANPSGTFVGTFDSGAAGSEWASVAWNTEPEGSEPTDTSIVVEVRSADSIAGLALETYSAATNGAGGLGEVGQYLQARAKLTPSGLGVSPVLSDIKASTVGGGIQCDIDGDGDVDRTDIGMISAARNTPAAPGDPRDNDGNGVIDVNDARQCVRLCTKSRCAS